MTQKWAWDKWQKEIIAYKGSVTARCGRQGAGKSTAVGKRAANQMLDYPGSKRLMIAPSQRQSSELFIKTLGWLEEEHQKALNAAGGWKDKPTLSVKANLDARRRFEYNHGIFNEIPTKTTIMLKKDFRKPQSNLNKGSMCYSLPAGRTGIFLRTYSLDFLDIDEAAYVPERVYNALKPMLAVSEKEKGLGWETLLSTPFGKGGFFYDSHHSKDYKKFHVSCEDCPRISKAFLKREKERLTDAEYRQEWCGDFIDEWNQLFPTALIRKCMTFTDWNRKLDGRYGAKYYLGVDFAGYGGSENAFAVCELFKKLLKIVAVETTIGTRAPDTIGRTAQYDEEWKFNRIFTDDGGLGSPITDLLQEKIGRKVIGLNNASKKIQVQGDEKKKGIMKEDLYTNARLLMEAGNLELINDPKLLRSLKSITFEYTTERRLKIAGAYSHLAEAMVRACWCIKERGLSLYRY